MRAECRSGCGKVVPGIKDSIRGLAGFPFPVIVDSFYCLTFLKVSPAPRAVQKASISWERFCQMIRDELCDQQQKWSWQSQCDGNLNITGVKKFRT